MTSIVKPRQLERLTALDGVVGVVALERAEPGPGNVIHDVGENRGLKLGAVHRRARGLGERGHGPHVVEVSVGDEDRLYLHPEGTNCLDEALGLVTRID